MSNSVLALSLALAMVIGVIWLYIDTRIARRRATLPEGEMIYADGSVAHEQVEMLTSETEGLVGKPDYLVQRPDGSLVPVEVKSSDAPPNKPYHSHVMQLIAYCLLVHENYGIRPEYGLIQYRDQAYEVEYTEELEEHLLDILHDMRNDMFEPNVERNHDNARICAGCGIREFCSERLA